MTAITQEWIEERCAEDADCLVWKLATDTIGQPRYTFRPGDGTHSTKNVRRVVYVAMKGPLSPRKFVTMTCKNPSCLNPDHMAVTTRSKITSETWKQPDTRARKVLAVMKTTRALRGKLDMEKARLIRASDKKNKELAEEFGVSHEIISRVRRGVAWQETLTNPFSGLFASNDSKKKAA